MVLTINYANGDLDAISNHESSFNRLAKLKSKSILLTGITFLCKSFLLWFFLIVPVLTSYANESARKVIDGHSKAYTETSYQADRKAFHFSDGTTGYLVSDDGQLYGVVDAADQVIVPKQYGSVSCHGDLFYCNESSIGKKNSCALYDKDGRCMISENDGFTRLNFVDSKGKLIVTSNSPMAVFDAKGNILYKYKTRKDSNGFVYLVNELTDTIVVKPGKYTDMFLLQDDIIHMWVGNKTGIMELDGTVVIPAIEYGSITPIRNGFLASLSKFYDGITGYLDRNGDCIIPAVNYSGIYPLKNGLFEVVANDKASIADSLGNILISTKYTGLYAVEDTSGNWYYETYLGNGKGKMTATGKVISEPQATVEKKEITNEGVKYTQIRDKNGKYGIISSSGKQIIPCEYNKIMFNKDVPGFKLFKNGFQGIADLNGKLIIPCNKYHYVTVSFESRRKKDFPLFFEVDSYGKMGLCDSLGNELVQPQFDDISPYTDSTAIAQLGLMQGIVDYSGNVLVPLEYTAISALADGTYEVQLFKKKGICTNKGQIVIPPRYNSIKAIAINDAPFDQLYKVKDGETVGLYSMEGNMLFPSGLFKNVSLYKQGEVLSSDPMDKVSSGLMGLRSATSTRKSSIDEKQFGTKIYIKAFNDLAENVYYYYDLEGHLLGDTSDDKVFYTNFDLGQKEFDARHYQKAIDYYKHALTVRQDGVTYYNIGAAFYNLDKYKDAISSLQACIRLKPRQSVMDDARDLILDCEYMLQQKREQRVDLIMGIFGTVLNVASTIIQANAAVKSYNSSSSHYKVPRTLNPQLFAQNSIVQISAQMESQKNRFLTQFRNNYRATMGHDPSELEEMQAYTQFLQSLNASYSGHSTGYTHSGSGGSTGNHVTTEQTTKQNKCGLCNGTGKIEASVANYGISDKKWCSECGEYRINGHYHKTCPSCNGTGMR